MSDIPKTMTAVVYRGANDLRVETLPVPRIRSTELLVKVAVCGVCPTDIKKIQYGTVPPPRVFGHETAGIVVRIGARVRGFKIGDRVALHHHVPCLRCHACRHRAFAQCAQYKRTGITAGFEPAGGGYAEYVRVMSFVLPGVVKIPHRNTFEEGAMLEPVNTVLKAVNRLALLRGDTVWVAGQGPIGLMFTRLLALRGMNVIATDLLEPRLRLARAFGARRIFQPVPFNEPGGSGRESAHSSEDRNPSQPTLAATGQGGKGRIVSGESNSQTGGVPVPVVDSRLSQFIHRLTRGRGLDAAVIAVPSDAVVRQAQALVRGAGQILLFAHTRRGTETNVDLAGVCVDEKDLLGSYSADCTLQRNVARLVFGRQLDARKLVTHRFPLEQTASAVELAAHPAAESLKVMVGGKGDE